MHIYSAAVYTNSYMPGQNRFEKLTPRERQIVTELPHILESWHYVGKQSYVDHMKRCGALIFLDSGAFSAYTLGVELKVEDYCNYICENYEIIRFDDKNLMASVLDGIGDAQKTYENQTAMESFFRNKGWNVRPLPCFHFGEDTRYLDYYIRNYEYITLGGMVGASTDQLINWLDKIWASHLYDGSGRARIKVHGFGITSAPVMERYDWYSCDSSSWIQSAAFGTAIVPRPSEPNPVWPIAVSGKSPSRHDLGQHISTLDEFQREDLDRFLAMNEFSAERLADVYESRAAFNLYAFCEINKIMDQRHKGKCFLYNQPGDLYNYIL